MKALVHVSDKETCGPCHPDADCIHSSVDVKKPGRVLKPVVAYKNPEVVLRIAEKAECSPKAAEGLFEKMKQYLARSAVSRRRSSPSLDVDLAWHEFLLFTIDYQLFCREHFGHFVHHVPTPRMSASEKATSCEDCAPLSNCETSQVGDR